MQIPGEALEGPVQVVGKGLESSGAGAWCGSGGFGAAAL